MSERSENLVEELYQQKLEGKSYSEIRANLSGAGKSPEEIQRIIRQVDELVLRTEVEGRQQAKALQTYKIGLILAVIGLILSVAFNIGIILTGFPPWLVYAPFLAGIGMMFYGRMLQRKKTEPFKKGPGRIRSKRPYK